MKEQGVCVKVCIKHGCVHFKLGNILQDFNAAHIAHYRQSPKELHRLLTGIPLTDGTILSYTYAFVQNLSCVVKIAVLSL